MFVIEGFIRNVVILLLGIISFNCFNAQGQDCYKIGDRKVCYFQPSETNTWDDAWTVCNKNESTLPVIGNRMMADVLRKHLELKKLLSGEIWLAGREIRTNVWQWLNGKPFANQSLFGNPEDLIKLYETNAVITGKLEYMLSYARDPKHYICQYNDSKLCQNFTRHITWKNGCLSTNDDKEFNLVEARNRCLDEGGDLATFEDDKDLESLHRYSRFLERNWNYWIGLRLNCWIWNETDSYEEIKYSNWRYYENRPNQNCLYIRLNDYKWDQDNCKYTKPFLCQIVNTVTQTQKTDDADSFSTTSSLKADTASQKDILLAITGSIIAVVIVAIIIVVIVVLLKIPRNRGLNSCTDEKLTELHEMSVHPIEKKSVTSKTIEVDDMSNHYAEIPRVVDHDNNDDCRDDPQPGILYAALEFDTNKAIYEEPVICSQPKQEATASIKVDASNENGQRGSSAGSPIQAAEGTIYANL